MESILAIVPFGWLWPKRKEEIDAPYPRTITAAIYERKEWHQYSGKVVRGRVGDRCDVRLTKDGVSRMFVNCNKPAWTSFSVRSDLDGELSVSRGSVFIGDVEIVDCEHAPIVKPPWFGELRDLKLTVGDKTVVKYYCDDARFHWVENGGIQIPQSSSWAD